MVETKQLIGLKWEPKLLGLSLRPENWFDMPAPTLTPVLKRDLQFLKLRTVMDPSVSRSKLAEMYFQASFRTIGSVIEPAEELYGRLTKKNIKASLAEELVSDPKTSRYRSCEINNIRHLVPSTIIQKFEAESVNRQKSKD
ncbi:predicted protein [Arabidopsis lyrata subsp. lyrata]|uniref:Predicted protein n=1 Tax=Arabidopsis lyrata subsp. lyrata TaxID=81972 RepID=D7MHP7_ARALL|nr:predicted protein [Arabidopsis lyrata subsp. lyrata]